MKTAKTLCTSSRRLIWWNVIHPTHISVVRLALKAKGQIILNAPRNGGTLSILWRKWYLKLYCRYLYTRPCMINHIWDLKQLWLQVNGHAWFHLQRLRWPVRNGEGAKNSKWKYMSPAGFEPTPRQSTTGKLQRLRPLGHEGLMVITG